jgi:DNA repair protein RecN (Recombination protein N)
MLRELHISNLAIIENIDIDLAAGLNVFTGQTGAGKSLILGSLELLLGLRDGGQDAATFVRPGCPEARVSGLFEIAGGDLAQRLGQILDQPMTPGEPILITRRVSSAGRSSVSVNGLPATAGMLRQAGQLLVDIHGQHDQQFLLKPANQTAILDSFADATDTRRQFAQTLGELRDCQRRLAELRQSEDRRLEALELYRFQIEEIDSSGLRPGEYEQVRDRYNVLRNATHLQDLSAQMLGGLCDGDDTVTERLGALQRCGQELVRMDAGLASLSTQLEQAGELLGDAARVLERYQDSLEADPSELAAVEERLDVLNRMIHKYARSAEPGGDPVTAVLDYRRQTGLKVEQLDADAQALGELDSRIARLGKALAATGQRLSALRRKAAARLKPLVEAQFRDLEMHEATFEVSLAARAADDPAIDSTGLDEMEFLVRTNPGQEMLPLRKIASGGEISRIMLALKTILADKDQVSVLVFDEIDANIGDRLGATIGRKMQALAHGRRPGGKQQTDGTRQIGAQQQTGARDSECNARGKAALRAQNQSPAEPDPKPHSTSAAAADPQACDCQIICITHLSQIAACADHHLHIRKEVVEANGSRQTIANVRVLAGEERVRELAEMMAGSRTTDATIAHARNLLAPAASKCQAPRPREKVRTCAVRC